MFHFFTGFFFPFSISFKFCLLICNSCARIVIENNHRHFSFNFNVSINSISFMLHSSNQKRHILIGAYTLYLIFIFLMLFLDLSGKKIWCEGNKFAYNLINRCISSSFVFIFSLVLCNSTPCQITGALERLVGSPTDEVNQPLASKLACRNLKTSATVSVHSIGTKLLMITHNSLLSLYLSMFLKKHLIYALRLSFS